MGSDTSVCQSVAQCIALTVYWLFFRNGIIYSNLYNLYMHEYTTLCRCKNSVSNCCYVVLTRIKHGTQKLLLVVLYTVTAFNYLIVT